jgi:hypothetical protein
VLGKVYGTGVLIGSIGLGHTAVDRRTPHPTALDAGVSPRYEPLSRDSQAAASAACNRGVAKSKNARVFIGINGA